MLPGAVHGRGGAWLLGLAACTPTDGSLGVIPQTGMRADALEGRLAGAVSNLGGAQGVEGRRRAAGSVGDTGGDPGGTDSAGDVETDPCATAAASRVLAEATGSSWLLTSPVFDLRSSAPNGGVYRAAEVLALESTGCTRLASFGLDSREFATGFASVVDPRSDFLVAPTGLMMRLVDVGDALWIFSNATHTWWTVDPDTGALAEGGTFDRPVAGAVADGSGGAWVSLSGVLAWEAGSTDQVGSLVQLDASGVSTGLVWDLPWSPASTGFGSLTPDGARLEPHFLSNDLTLDGEGTLWVLDSASAQVAAVDPATGATTVTDLDVVYPTGIAAVGEELVITGGLVSDASGLVQSPGLWTLDPAGVPATTALVSLPEPASGWALESGFVSRTGGGDTGSAGASDLFLDRWLSLAPLGTGQVLVADPAYERVLLID